MVARNAPRLRWVASTPNCAGFWCCESARVKGCGNTAWMAWCAWAKNCHTVTKVTQTAIGDTANKADTLYIATNDTEAPQ